MKGLETYESNVLDDYFCQAVFLVWEMKNRAACLKTVSTILFLLFLLTISIEIGNLLSFTKFPSDRLAVLPLAPGCPASHKSRKFDSQVGGVGNGRKLTVEVGKREEKQQISVRSANNTVLL